jgi:hypothetical protein
MLEGKYKSFITVAFALIITAVFMFEPLRAPFFARNDGLSDLLPIIQYKYSILNEHALPLHTDLWYGGRAQWENPLSSILYFPVTFQYLLFPLNIATKIVYFLHFFASLIMGYWIAKQFIDKWLIQLSIGIMFTSPMVLMINNGHVEKIFSWPWVLAGLGFLFNKEMSNAKKGLFAGICLGIIPLTGSNYYAFYALILFPLLVSSFPVKKVWPYFVLGSSIGLLHLPFVAYLAQITDRGQAAFNIEINHMNLSALFKSLFLGNSQFLVVNDWESYSLIGLPFALCLLVSVFLISKRLLGRQKIENIHQILAVIFAGIVFLCIALGWAYRWSHLLDTFRIPSRVTPFIGLVLIVFFLLAYKNIPSETKVERYVKKGVEILVIFSTLQIMWYSWNLRPSGSDFWIDNPGVMELTTYLKEQKAKNVWIDPYSDTSIVLPVSLMNQNIGVINPYYGDMGQSEKITGKYCGYSFDFLLLNEKQTIDNYTFSSDNWAREEIPTPADPKKFIYLRSFRIMYDLWHVYATQCTINDDQPTP